MKLCRKRPLYLLHETYEIITKRINIQKTAFLLVNQQNSSVKLLGGQVISSTVASKVVINTVHDALYLFIPEFFCCIKVKEGGTHITSSTMHS